MSAVSNCSHLRSFRAPPKNGAIVLEEECSQCFINQDDESGINICLHCLNPGCEAHSVLHSTAKSHFLALNVIRKKVISEEAPQKITKVAIGVAGGGGDQEEKFTLDFKVRCFQCNFSVNIFDANITPAVTGVVSSILAAEPSQKKAERVSWEKEIVPCAHTLNLVQPPRETGAILAKSLATCNACSINSNLWLCLTCGYLGCGRKNYDGSGGNNHAVEHHAQSGHAVVCKMGTITAEGTADIFCYACDDTCLDPHLATHLRHFGIEIESQVVTEKTTTQLQLELNLKFDFSMTSRDGKPLNPLYGPGLTGLVNLGNSCYMASILQVLFSIDSFKQTYFPTLLNHRSTCTNSNHATCFACQMEKVAEGLLSGRYSVSRPKSKQALAQEEQEQQRQQQEQQRQQQQQPQQQQEESPLTEEEKLKRDELDRGQLGIKPLMFKSLIGAEHPEFATMRQQDAFEFFEYFCSQLEQKERTRLGSAADGRLPTSVFDFALEQRLECLSCHGARYSTSNSNVASIPLVRHKLEESSVPADTADNAATAPATTTQATTATVALSTSTNKKEPPMPKEVAYFDESLALFAADEVVEFRCPVCGANPAGAVKRNRFLTTPDVLVVHAKRFVYEDWVPRKLDIDFKVPDSINLSNWLAVENKPSDEFILPEVAEKNDKNAGPEPDARIVAELESMGFQRVGCEKAALATNNSGVEAAMNWLVEHLEDPDLNTPVAKANASNSVADETAISQLGDMGFTRAQAIRALKETSGNTERAVDWLFSHPDVTGEEADMDTSSGSSSNAFIPGNKRPPNYKLFALVTHKGTSVHSGHYVAHVRKDGRWVFFNDNKVAEDPSPPVGGAYLYFFVKE